MRIAAIYDIHGNLPALESVLAAIEAIGVDSIVVGGDVIPGPMPNECVSRLRALSTPTSFLSGNGEREVLEMLAGEKSRHPKQIQEVLRWVGEELLPDHLSTIATWPTSVEIEHPELGRVLFCHATPKSDSDIFTPLTPEPALTALFEAATADVVICGHTHVQFERHIASTRVVNAGSVGMPFDDPGAYWLLLGIAIEFHHTEYDLPGAADRIRATRYPMATQFAEENVVSPPKAKTMIEALERAALNSTQGA